MSTPPESDENDALKESHILAIKSEVDEKLLDNFELRPDDPCYLEKLPIEVLDTIVRMLPLPERLDIRCVSRHLNNVVSSRFRFHPLLNTATSDICKGFLTQPTGNVLRKLYDYDELLVGNLSGADCSWLRSSNLEQIEIIRFLEQITQDSLVSIRLLIQHSTNLRHLDFKKYNFHHFQLGQLNKAGELNEAFQRVSYLSIKGKLNLDLKEKEWEMPNPLGAQLDSATFDCKDLSPFTSLLHLELLTMGNATLENVSSLPISLRNLRLFTEPVQRSDLMIIITTLLNLEKLVLQSYMHRAGLTTHNE